MPKGNSLAIKIGNQVKKLRLERRLSQFDLAEKAGIGISYISKIEQGNRLPSIKTSLRLAKALGVDLGELFTFTTKTGERRPLPKEQLQLISILPKLAPDDIKILLDLARKLEAK